MCLSSPGATAAIACSLRLWDSRGFNGAGLVEAAVLHTPRDWGGQAGDDRPCGAEGLTAVDALSL